MQKENTKYSRGAGMVSMDGMRCGWYKREKGGLVGLPAITFGTT